MEDIIVCEGLNKYYSGVHALKDLSLKIKKDSVVGLNLVEIFVKIFVPNV